MSRATLLVAVGLGAYTLLNIACSLAVGAAWRWRIIGGRPADPAARARVLVALRAMPSLAATTISLLIVMPAFATFEPHHASEPAGPLLIALAAIGAIQLGMSMLLAVISVSRTRSVARRWLRSGTLLTVHPPAGVPVYAIDSVSPIVALVGVFAPKLVAARTVIDACTPDELRSIVAHERGHLHARDNLKRWFMACAPDALRWTPIHHEIAIAWHNAAEDAADDAAAGKDDRARANLAALLVKIARLTPEPVWPAATVSPFIERDGLPRRVRRLLDAANPAKATRYTVPMIAIATTLMTAAVIVSRTALKDVFDIVEALVAFGR